MFRLFTEELDCAQISGQQMDKVNIRIKIGFMTSGFVKEPQIQGGL